MHGCTHKIQHTSSHYSRLGVSLVAAAITLIALGAIGFGIIRMNPRIYKFYVLRFAIASIAAGSILTGLALAILCYRTKEQRLIPLKSVTVNEKTPPVAEPTPPRELEIKRWGHTVILPHSLTPYHQMDGMPDNSYYRDEEGTSICANLRVDGVERIFFHSFSDRQTDPVTLLHESFKNKPNHLAALLFPKLREKREYSPDNYLMTIYCNMEILSPRHIPAESCERKEDRIIIQTTLVINGVNQEYAFDLPATTGTEIPLLIQEEINKRSYYCEFQEGLIASKTMSYQLITTAWQECLEDRPLKDGEYCINGSTYSFCHTLRSDTGHLHHGTISFTPQENAKPDSFREQVLVALATQFFEGKIKVSRARHSRYDPVNTPVTN